MISGPTIPNNLGNLRDLVVSQIGLIEHGLRVLTQDLVLGHDALVDVLACDATGAPVLLFVAAPESAPGLPARVLGAQLWVRQNGSLLGEELADPDLCMEQPPRLVVVGLEILADTVADLRRREIDGLTILQFCSFTVGGRLRLGLSELLGDGLAGAPVLARGGSDPFRVPSGIVEPPCRALCARFLDLCRKVDPRMTATGDRFSRRLFLGGRLVAALGMTAGKLRIHLPGLGPGIAEVEAELTQEICLDFVDRVLRFVLAMEVGVSGPGTDDDFEITECVPASAAASAPMDGSAAGRADLSAGSPAGVPPVPPEPDPRQGSEHDHSSLEPIRRSVANAQLSREEFSALGEGSDS